jgi:hypothetical protein
MSNYNMTCFLWPYKQSRDTILNVIVYLSRDNTEIDALFTIYIFLLLHRNPIEVLQHGQYSFESDIYRLAMSIYEFCVVFCGFSLYFI